MANRSSKMTPIASYQTILRNTISSDISAPDNTNYVSFSRNAHLTTNSHQPPCPVCALLLCNSRCFSAQISNLSAVVCSGTCSCVRVVASECLNRCVRVMRVFPARVESPPAHELSRNIGAGPIRLNSFWLPCVPATATLRAQQDSNLRPLVP